MKIIIGLGNPGDEYIGTRHNVGRDCVRAYATEWSVQKKLYAEIASYAHAQEKTLLALPTTYMNESGIAAQATLHYYKQNTHDLILIHDDIDLPLGSLRIVERAGPGGHNGIASIQTILDTKDIIRIRIGVAGATRSRTDAAKYVLAHFTKTEQRTLTVLNKIVKEVLDVILTDGVGAAMNRFN